MTADHNAEYYRNSQPESVLWAHLVEARRNTEAAWNDIVSTRFIRPVDDDNPTTYDPKFGDAVRRWMSCNEKEGEAMIKWLWRRTDPLVNKTHPWDADGTGGSP